MVHKILCAVDGTTHSDKAVQFAAELANKLGSKLTIASVNVMIGGARTGAMYIKDDKEVQEALDTLRADYPTLEAGPAIETLAGEMAVGHDIEFFSLDMVNTCRTRSFHGPAGTVFVMCQASGADQEEDYDSALRAVCASMRAEE